MVEEQDYWKHLASLNKETFREMMTTYGQDVWNYAFFVTKRADLADDISQDVFLKVYQNIGSFRGESSFKTWLISITRNIAINYRRSAFIRKVTLVDWMVRKETHSSAEDEVMELCLAEDIWQVVLKLPVKYREVLILDAKYDLTMNEIADVLGISQGTVKSRLSRARSKVSVIWKEWAAYERV